MEVRYYSNLGQIEYCLYSLSSDKFQQNKKSKLAIMTPSEALTQRIPSFFLIYSSPCLGSALVIMAPSCSVVEIISNLILCFKSPLITKLSSYVDVRLVMVAEDSLFRSIDRNRGSTTRQQRYYGWRNHHVDSQPSPILHCSLQTSQ